MTTLTVELECSEWQEELMTATDPVLATVTPVRDGKTWGGSRWVVLRAVKYPESVHLVTANGYPQIKDVVVPAIREALEEMDIKDEMRSKSFPRYCYKKQDHDFEISLSRGTTALIQVRSTDSEKSVNRLRGTEYGSWWQDEGRDADDYVYQVVSTRMSCPNVPRPQSRLTTTPGGRANWLYQRFVKKPKPGRRLLHVTQRTNTHLIAGYDEGLAGDLDIKMAEQELRAGFIDIGTGSVYHAFDPALHVRPLAWDATRPIALAVDYGAECYAVVNQVVNGQILAHACFTASGTYALADLVHEAYPTGHIDLYDDTAGAATRADENRTWRANLLMRLRNQHVRSVTPRLPLSSNPRVVARALTVNAAMRNERGEIHHYMTPECEALITDYEACLWKKDGTGLDKSNPDLTHYSDAEGYLIYSVRRVSAFEREPGWMPSARGRERKAIRDR